MVWLYEFITLRHFIVYCAISSLPYFHLLYSLPTFVLEIPKTNYLEVIDTLALHSLERKNGYQNRLERDLLQRQSWFRGIPQSDNKWPMNFFICSKICSKLGYKSSNWNLGCPLSMVTKSGMGSGLISNPKKINNILHRAILNLTLLCLWKCVGIWKQRRNSRCLFDAYIAIHSRIGKQLYKVV
jgi:hypothetical protein